MITKDVFVHLGASRQVYCTLHALLHSEAAHIVLICSYSVRVVSTFLQFYYLLLLQLGTTMTISQSMSLKVTDFNIYSHYTTVI